jgi:hypothetical protein
MSNSRLTRNLVGVGLVAIAAASVWAASGTGATSRQADLWAQDSTLGAAPSLKAQLALARSATAKYVNDLARAKADGYRIITRMIPNMGYHFMNPNVRGFDVTRPPILVYDRRGSSWQLGAIEWVFTSRPTTAPLPGARYGAFGAGCHYADGTFVPASSQAACPKKDPETGAAFGFWHPNLVTMHVWLWYPNPNGLFASTNPLVAPFNEA